MAKNPRKVKNLLINPKFQLKFSLYFIVSGMALIGVMMAVIFSKLQTLSDTISLNGSLDFRIQNQLNALIFDVTWISLLAFLCFALIVLFYSIVISHRIAGPTVAIRAYISEIKSGNYDAERTLRKYDELHPIMDSLKDLAQSLKNKNN